MRRPWVIRMSDDGWGWTEGTKEEARAETVAAAARRESSVSGMDEGWLREMQALKEVEAAKEAAERRRRGGGDPEPRPEPEVQQWGFTDGGTASVAVEHGDTEGEPAEVDATRAGEEVGEETEEEDEEVAATAGAGGRMFDAAMGAVGMRDAELDAVQALYEAGGEAHARGGVGSLVEAVSVAALATEVTLEGLAGWERARWEAGEQAEEAGREPPAAWEGDGPWMFPLLQQCLKLLSARVEVQATRTVRMLEMNEILAKEVEVLAEEAGRHRAEAARLKARLREVGGLDATGWAVQMARKAVTVQRWFRGYLARKRASAARADEVRTRRSLVGSKSKGLQRSQSLASSQNRAASSKRLTASSRTSSAPLARRERNART